MFIINEVRAKMAAEAAELSDPEDVTWVLWVPVSHP